MDSGQMGFIMQKRGAAMTGHQWSSLLKELEEQGLYLVIKSNNPCLTKSPAGGFIPAHAKNDQFLLLTHEQLLERGLQPGHHILTDCKSIIHHVTNEKRDNP
ncbi:hypothetical protein BEP19_06470 [Ammoniphilus oxalaticus]|uniref:Uncharacterized protein n=1 Tax=Ammoniphilus oxalaticus TaxID=66863 RepID=A0A419SJD6_9BACL|nr:hypothetical protein [Ammoniphilus oxalaticus]RKD24049.1 hypothetical protein BEP19_06470 [Ammoniphilus oxalaticus]